MSVNRQTYRDYLVDLLTTALVGDGLPVQQVYGHLPADFEGQSPVVCVTTAGSKRVKTQHGKKWDTKVKLQVFVFTLYAKVDESWTEAMAEDQLDLIESIIAQTLMTYEGSESGAPWDYIGFDGESKAGFVPLNIGGPDYKREMFPISAEVING